MSSRRRLECAKSAASTQWKKCCITAFERQKEKERKEQQQQKKQIPMGMERPTVIFLSSPAISLPTRRRFRNGLFLRALCDMTGARVQLYTGKCTLGEVLRRGPKVAYRTKSREKTNQERARNVKLSLFELVSGLFRLFYRPDPSL